MVSALRSLKQLAVTGTDAPGKVLLHAAGLRTEYHPRVHAAPMPLAWIPDKTPTCGPHAESFLRMLITVSTTTYNSAFVKDWCLVAIENDRLAPKHAARVLLTFGEAIPSTQPFIAPIIGRHGQIIGRELGVEWLAFPGEIVHRDVNVLAPAGINPLFNSNSSHRAPWTASLVRAATERLFGYLDDTPETLDMCARKFHRVMYWGPIEEVEGVLARCEQIDTDGPQFSEGDRARWAQKLYIMQSIVMVRRALRAAFDADEAADA